MAIATLFDIDLMSVASVQHFAVKWVNGRK